MDLIEEIGPFVGLAAFIGLAALAFVIFQQSRDIRRLREWAGRAPERAQEAADASLAAGEARGDASGEERPGRFAVLWGQITGPIGSRFQALDRNLPLDGRIVLGVLAAGVIAAGVLTSGFGLIGGDEKGKRAERRQQQADLPEIAVLNATQTPDGVAGVSGLADKVADEVVRQAGYAIGETRDAPTGFEETVVMFDAGREGDAAQFARAIEQKLGETPTEEMAPDVKAQIGRANLALLIGADDAGF